uniref:CSON005650 protein n=1 Tax=Culicoides sonorensis TaxID=179676 RepID=A0A336LJA7_CULSO
MLFDNIVYMNKCQNINNEISKQTLIKMFIFIKNKFFICGVIVASATWVISIYLFTQIKLNFNTSNVHKKVNLKLNNFTGIYRDLPITRNKIS